MNWKYADRNCIGDRICYISGLTKLKSHYPNWSVTMGLEEIFRQIIADHTRLLSTVEPSQ